MEYIFKKFSLICAVIMLFAFVQVDTLDAKPRKTSKTKKTRYRRVERVMEDPQLMADKVTLKRDINKVDSIMMAMEMENEGDEFPSDDLYNSDWNNQRVNPYSNSQIPDSFRIDVSSFVMPFEGCITSKYGPRGRRFHYGTDIKVEVGDTIRAAFDGKVRVKYYQGGGYGYYMVLRHSNGLETVYGHLSKFLVDLDNVVKAGEPIALGGNTGRSTGPHLHLEMRFLGQPINPAEIIDFSAYSTFDEIYVFSKAKSASIINKYTSEKRKITYHRIKKGDTLAKVAKKYRVSVKQLCKINKVKPNTKLKAGKTLRCS